MRQGWYARLRDWYYCKELPVALTLASVMLVLILAVVGQAYNAACEKSRNDYTETRVSIIEDYLDLGE